MGWRESGQWRTASVAAGGPDAAVSVGRITPAGAPGRRGGEANKGEEEEKIGGKRGGETRRDCGWKNSRRSKCFREEETAG